MESYSPRTVFSSIDTRGRYAYGNQPLIACWNLARFAETLLPLIEDASPDRAAEAATEVVHGFMPRYQAEWLAGARAKLGLSVPADDETDRKLVEDWLELLEQHAVDFTLGWRRLADAAEGKSDAVAALFPAADTLRPWLTRWRDRQAAGASATAEAMRSVSPIYIPRNHLVEEALTAASENGDLTLFEGMLDVLANPYQERVKLERYAQPAPKEFTACYSTFCGT